MSEIERFFRELRRKLERLGSDLPPGPGEIDLARLDDDELARLERLWARVGSTEPRREVHPREKVLARMEEPARATRERAWAAGLGTPPPETAVVGGLDGDELREIQALLMKARIPKPGKGDR